MNAVRRLSVLAGLLFYVTAQEVEQVDFDCVTQAVIGRVSSRDTEQRYSVSFQEDFFEPGKYLKGKQNFVMRVSQNRKYFSLLMQ